MSLTAQDVRLRRLGILRHNLRVAAAALANGEDVLLEETVRKIRAAWGVRRRTALDYLETLEAQGILRVEKERDRIRVLLEETRSTTGQEEMRAGALRERE